MVARSSAEKRRKIHVENRSGLLAAVIVRPLLPHVVGFRANICTASRRGRVYRKYSDSDVKQSKPEPTGLGL